MNAFTRLVANIFFGTATFLVLVVFIAKPALRDIETANGEVKGKKIELAELDQQIRAFKNAQTDLAKATRKDEISDSIVIKEDLVLPVKDIESAATNTSSELLLEIKDLGPKDKASNVISKRQGVEEVPYIATVINDYSGIIKFISYLEYLPHFTEISKINLSAETMSGTEDTLIHTGRVFGNIEGVFFVKAKTK